MKTDEIVSILRAEVPTLEFAYLFGSQYAGTATESSDVDIAIKTGAKLSFEERMRIAGLLSDALGKEVDLVDLSDADDTLKMQVIEKGGVIYAKSPLSVAEFEMYALSDYIRLNELRRGILEDFATTHHVLQVVGTRPRLIVHDLPTDPFLSSPNRGCIFRGE